MPQYYLRVYAPVQVVSDVRHPITDCPAVDYRKLTHRPPPLVPAMIIVYLLTAPCLFPPSMEDLGQNMCWVCSPDKTLYSVFTESSSDRRVSTSESQLALSFSVIVYPLPGFANHLMSAHSEILCFEVDESHSLQTESSVGSLKVRLRVYVL